MNKEKTNTKKTKSISGGEIGAYRVSVSGGWFEAAEDLQVFFHDAYGASVRNNFESFRLVLQRKRNEERSG